MLFNADLRFAAIVGSPKSVDSMHPSRESVPGAVEMSTTCTTGLNSTRLTKMRLPKWEAFKGDSMGKESALMSRESSGVGSHSMAMPRLSDRVITA